MNIIRSTEGQQKLLEKYNQYFEQNCFPNFGDLLWQIIVNDLYNDKTVVFVPIPESRLTIGIAEKNETGYTPTRVGFAPGIKYDQAQEILTELNEAIFGLNEKLSMEVIISSMRKGMA